MTKHSAKSARCGKLSKREAVLEAVDDLDRWLDSIETSASNVEVETPQFPRSSANVLICAPSHPKLSAAVTVGQLQNEMLRAKARKNVETGLDSLSVPSTKRRRGRSHNRAPFTGTPSIEEKVRRGWVTLLKTWEKSARVIVTLRCHNESDPDKLFSAAKKLNQHMNRHLLGPGWQQLKFSHQQVAVFGVIEGDGSSCNLHMHLVVYRRTPIPPEIIEETNLWLKDRGIVRECWLKLATQETMDSYNSYILKGAVLRGPGCLGKDISDRVYLSPSLENLR